MAKQPEISDVLNSLSKDELVQIITQMAEQDERFKNGLLVKYSQGDRNGQLQLCKKLMDSIVNKYANKDGFIPYRETHGFAMEMLGLLEETDGAADSGLVLEIALMVMEEGVAAFQYADDSGGSIGMLVDESLGRIWGLANSLDREDTSPLERFFERLLKASGSRMFDGWEDYRVELLRICVELAEAEKLRERLRAVIEQQITDAARQEYGKYTAESLLQLLFHLIQNYGSEEEADKFLEDHLQYSSFRERAIEIGMEGGNYHRVIQLAEEGEQKDKQLPGLLVKWKKARYEAYKKLSLKDEQRQLAKELLLGGDYAYYQELESLAEGDKEHFYRTTIAELKQANNWRVREVYLKLISDRNDRVEMLAYVRTNPSEIEEYAPRLAADYRDEVERIYRDYIYRTAGIAANRKDYQRVCAMLKRYQKLFGKESQSEIILQLKTQYNRRPAFLDELSGIK